MSLAPLHPKHWDYWKAAHLLQRAGFGGSVEEVEALRALGVERAVHSLLNRKEEPPYPAPEWAVPENLEALRLAEQGLDNEARRELQRQRQKEQRQKFLQFVGWWLQRMYETNDPATEKLTLFWHGHFATSEQKVRNPYYLWLQYDTLRSHAMGEFPTLVKAVMRDPAMLIYLDGDRSLAGSPNENFAREVMELFTLGEGNYTEHDIQEAARAFTGYRINPANQTSRFAPLQHDDGEKVLFGKRGRFTGEDAIDIIVKQKACAPFMSWKLLRYYVSENPPPGLVQAFAAELIRQKFQIRPALATLFRSAAFYSPKAVQVKGPVEWLVGTARRLGATLPPYNISFQMLTEMGQILYQPPNVKGWDGGRTWISTSTLFARYNYAAMLSGAEAIQRGRRNSYRIRPTLFVSLPEEARANPSATVDFLAKALFTRPLTPREKAPFEQFMQGKKSEPAVLSRLAHLMMSTPQYQLS